MPTNAAKVAFSEIKSVLPKASLTIHSNRSPAVSLPVDVSDPAICVAAAIFFGAWKGMGFSSR